MKPELEETLQHYGVKGMKWGKRMKTHVDSIKREHSWKKKLKDSDRMSTKDIQKVAARAQLENDFKRLSKKKNVGSDKSKQDYLKRANMDDKELSRKVQRLRAKDQLDRNANEITKSQREMAKRIVQVAAPIAIKYALTGRISRADLIAAALVTGGGKAKMVKTAMDEANKVKKQNNTKHGENLDDILLHFGVKGMKWGVVRSKIQKAGRAYNRKQSDKRKAANAKYHEKRKSRPSYKAAYKTQLKRTKGDHEKAVTILRTQNAKQKRALIGMTLVQTSPFLIKNGKKLARKAAKAAANPENIRRGKNIVQALKRSPIRYVDGKTMTNVVGTIF